MRRPPVSRDIPSRDPNFWAEHYQSDDDPPWQIPEACPPAMALIDAEEELSPEAGRSVIVVGCGRGLESAALHERGFQVTAIDLCPAAIDQARARYPAAINYQVADVLDPPEALIGGFDLLLEQTCFCAIDPIDRDRYVVGAHRLLRPGGSLVGVFYEVENDGGPPFRTELEEVRSRFAPRFAIRRLARAENSTARREGRELLAWFVREA